MTVYTVTQTATGVALFEGEARDEAHALDLMARDAGYADYASIPAEIGGGDTLAVIETCMTTLRRPAADSR